MSRARRPFVLFVALLVMATMVPALATVAAHRPATPARPAAPAPAATPETRGAVQLARATAAPQAVLNAIATFGGTRPAAEAVAGLRALGLQVQPLRHLPLALLRGPKQALLAAASRGLATDVYPDEPLTPHWTTSTDTMRIDEVRQTYGLTGEGIGVAIVDTGVDGTHPDLADHMARNVKVVGPEYTGLVGVQQQSSAGSLVVPVDQGPYNNGDTSGHGTHVAGIVAADGTTDPTQVGVAPDAHLVGYGTGDVLFIFTVLGAYDDILAQREALNIRVVNNSWGSGFRLFDPDHPINQATKALHDAGIVVAFSAGNDGDLSTINPYSVAPWVISVASATVSQEKSYFTSGGVPFDASTVAPVSDDHQRFDGDRLGLYHPDVTGPGSDIVSSGTPTGIGVVAPAPPGGTATLSGTSMSSPHIAGVAALLLEARPELTPDEVAQVLQVTAVPMADGSSFTFTGFGYVDAKAAIDLVAGKKFSARKLAKLQAAADQRVLADRDWQVRSTDLWRMAPLPVTVGGLDYHEFPLAVDAATEGFYASVSYPSTSLIGVNFFDYEIALHDPEGNVVAASEPSGVAGVSTLQVDLRELDPRPAAGEWTVTVSGLLGASDTDTVLGNQVTAVVSQLTPQDREAPPGTTFTPSGSLPLHFTPEGEAGPLTSPEGCAMEQGAPTGGLVGEEATAECHAGTMGYTVNYGADQPAEFVSEPLEEPLTVGDAATITLYLADSAQPVWSQGFAAGLAYVVDAVPAEGDAVPLASGDATPEVIAGPQATKGEYSLSVPPTTIPAGSRLRLQLRISGFYTSTMRLLYGGEFSDAGIQLTTGTLT